MAQDLHQIVKREAGNWSRSFENWPVVISVARGLEGACAGIARREARLRLKPLGPGLLQDHKSAAHRLETCLRAAPVWSFGSFVKVFTLDAERVASSAGQSDAINSLNAAVEHFGLDGQTYWLNCQKEESKAAKSLAKKLLGSMGLNLENNPSDYRLTLRLASDGDIIHGLLGPSISVRERFAYRRKDVGASINPVLAAAMVRLSPPAEGGLVVDPTCGSGTFLAERMAFSRESEALGIDVSTRAQEVYAVNLQAKSLPGRFLFKLGDSANPSLWSPCRSVVANLPFGQRSRQPRDELTRLYFGVLANTADFLEPGGQVIVTTSFKRLLDEAVERQRKRLRILSRYKAEMGGLVYQILVAEKS